MTQRVVLADASTRDQLTLTSIHGRPSGRGARSTPTPARLHYTSCRHIRRPQSVLKLTICFTVIGANLIRLGSETFSVNRLADVSNSRHATILMNNESRSHEFEVKIQSYAAHTYCVLFADPKPKQIAWLSCKCLTPHSDGRNLLWGSTRCQRIVFTSLCLRYPSATRYSVNSECSMVDTEAPIYA
ncbi:hypothetical protein A0H81_09271 [Grifola frondosa]|uniref:Uncharacterized protein n=1 Tax=Grifola frondosa TaxID=5627 RepID=A0A1C7M1H6_GRIFR|nr:hypothetical protein A0H81_09271 [Grifola frondosa]